ncbi:TetR/AcrR family transcriptional regulator [Nocardioides daeguensis]|uniref:TetR/AcrR family transcriptional regulator n=1 Tax=Nocardioides daeguensis TaxID=908359 RepID=A0ABP6V798_9ACTN|nr:WHG domain-containing protein [Nocardioides daeguensis]MBV6726445.1 WHG domain-containing protein [Nocardioides daeguensis]MCR1772288.1 WHG domain-containing protein [Nocardioides daeguensis]
MPHLRAPATRRERQREATYDEIVAVSARLLDEGADLSLRAVAAGMGLTAPALYRYVASYQQLVDLVAFELDKAATAEWAEAAARFPQDDPAARLAVACTRFRQWALTKPRRFALVFANPVAADTERRDLVTLSTSGHYFTDLLWQIWEIYRFPYPALDELDPVIREAVLDPLIPAKSDHIPTEDRGLLWVYMRAWSALYGVVTLESTGHCDPRVIESGQLFRATLLDWLEPLGLHDERERITTILDEELARP